HHPPRRLSVWTRFRFSHPGRRLNRDLRRHRTAPPQRHSLRPAGRARHHVNDDHKPAALRSFLSDVLSQLPREGVWSDLCARTEAALHPRGPARSRHAVCVSRRCCAGAKRTPARLWRESDVLSRRLALREAGLRNSYRGFRAKADDVFRTRQNHSACQWLCLLAGRLACAEPRDLHPQWLYRSGLLLVAAAHIHISDGNYSANRYLSVCCDGAGTALARKPWRTSVERPDRISHDAVSLGGFCPHQSACACDRAHFPLAAISGGGLAVSTQRRSASGGIRAPAARASSACPMEQLCVFHRARRVVGFSRFLRPAAVIRLGCAL